MKNLVFARGVIAAVLLFALGGCGGKASDTTSIRLAHTLPVNHPVHESLVFLGETLSDLSGGTMELEIYPSGQLGSEREIVELIQIGTLGMTKVSASSLEAFIPEMKLFSLPYLFNDGDHYWQVLDSEIGEELLLTGVDYRIRGIGYFDAGSRSFYSTEKRIEKPEDLNGLKIRVMTSQSAVNMVNTIGGAATPVNFGELYSALQQGIVDGAENNPPSFYFSKHYEVSKYYLLDEHTSIPDIIVIGTHAWNGLSEQQQTWLSEAMKQATAFQKKLWAESTELSLQKAIDSGVEVIRADKRLFQEKVAPIYDKIDDPTMMKYVDDIRNMGEK